MKLPEKQAPLPRLDLVRARWRATCGWCLAQSRVVDTNDERDAWNEIASTEGFVCHEPGRLAPPLAICLQCAEEFAATGRVRSPHDRIAEEELAVKARKQR